MGWLRRFVLGALGCALLAPPAAAEIYRWTDSQGRDHFVTDLSQVPPAAPQRLRGVTYTDDLDKSLERMKKKAVLRPGEPHPNNPNAWHKEQQLRRLQQKAAERKLERLEESDEETTRYRVDHYRNRTMKVGSEEVDRDEAREVVEDEIRRARQRRQQLEDDATRHGIELRNLD